MDVCLETAQHRHQIHTHLCRFERDGRSWASLRPELIPDLFLMNKKYVSSLSLHPNSSFFLNKSVNIMVSLFEHTLE